MNIDLQYRYTKTYIFNIDSLIKIKNYNKLKIVCRTLKYKKYLHHLNSSNTFYLERLSINQYVKLLNIKVTRYTGF